MAGLRPLLPWAAILTCVSLLPSCSGEEKQAACLALDEAQDPWPSSRCAPCHADIHRIWQGSHHALAERALEPGTMQVEDVGPDGILHAYPALRSIGVDPLVQYLIDLDGNLQVSQQARDTRDGTWFDVHADGRGPGEWGHWTGRGMNWDTMCAVCHNTGVERRWSMEEDRFTTTVSEHGVGCVACHGSGEKRLPTDESCFSCHARRAELAPADGIVPFLDYFNPALPDAAGIFHVDGQILEESFEYTSFALSKMSAAGVGCLDCHEPHGGQLRASGDALCLTCHAGNGRLPAPVIEPIPHSGHTADAALSCTDCHMPTSLYMQRDPRHDHGFLIPDPRLTVELGVPNACNRCHQERTPDWAAAIVEARPSWTGNPETRRRARAVHAVRSAHESALPMLLESLAAESHPGWRATLLGLLAPWSADPAARTLLLAAATSDEALIRSKALPHPDMLEDPVRLVRLRAPRAAGPRLDLQSRAGQDLLQSFLHNRGRAGAAMAEAEFLLDSGHAQALEQVAIPLTERVATWDRSTPMPLQLKAMVLDRLDRRAEALAVMEACCVSFPEDARSWYLLGLSAGAAEDYGRCKVALEQGLRLQPDYPDASRNLQAILEFEQQE